jgi:PII-like signaling protein
LVEGAFEHDAVVRLLPRSRMARARSRSDAPAKIETNMQIPQDAVLLRIFIGESDRHGHRPLYEAIVLKAREMQMAGATVLRGPMGFGKSSHLHTAKILRLSMDLPIVIEIVDSEEKVNAFLPMLDEMIGGGLVTLERAKVIRYQHQEKK